MEERDVARLEGRESENEGSPDGICPKAGPSYQQLRQARKPGG